MSDKNISMRFNPDEPAELDKIIRGSYDDFVRLERRNLLAASSITFISFYSSINPSGFSLSGIKIPNLDVESLFSILFFTCLYFLVAHIIYAYPGFREALKKWSDTKARAMLISGDKHRFPIEIKNFISSFRYILWLFFSYVLPVILGVVALVISVCKIA